MKKQKTSRAPLTSGAGGEICCLFQIDQNAAEDFNLTSDGEFNAIKSLVLGKVHGKETGSGLLINTLTEQTGVASPELCWIQHCCQKVGPTDPGSVLADPDSKLTLQSYSGFGDHSACMGIKTSALSRQWDRQRCPGLADPLPEFYVRDVRVCKTNQ